MTQWRVLPERGIGTGTCAMIALLWTALTIWFVASGPLLGAVAACVLSVIWVALTAREHTGRNPDPVSPTEASPRA
ncbi:hypothetical protein [Rhodococcus artemisiae]|uniref:Uncharacterized protein n=1 Tax=Rhodococcus artemisiae TaxID=714159 RepID=A0ABU7LJ05_9NOCA|nr:hypothetical protein [Rhodococcus artemisiae]MEE2061546.1 hypothetical protein [Rhodococcus artemisiae]